MSPPDFSSRGVPGQAFFKDRVQEPVDNFHVRISPILEEFYQKPRRSHIHSIRPNRLCVDDRPKEGFLSSDSLGRQFSITRAVLGVRVEELRVQGSQGRLEKEFAGGVESETVDHILGPRLFR